MYLNHGGIVARIRSAFEIIENANSLLRFVGFNTVKPEDCIANWYVKDLETLTTAQLGKLRHFAYKEQQKKNCSSQTRSHCQNIRDRVTKILIKRALEEKYGRKKS